MENNNYLEDIKEIKEIMNRTTRFISLSGLSGISTGLTALSGLLIAYYFVFKDKDYLVFKSVSLTRFDLIYLILIAVITHIISITCAILFTIRKSKLQRQNILDIQTKRLLINLSIPLITGGLLCLMLLQNGFIGILPSITLIFYGLALVNSSKYTLPEIRNLGLIEILIGLLAFQFINYSLIFWALGFGGVQIIYGIIIQKKY